MEPVLERAEPEPRPAVIKLQSLSPPGVIISSIPDELPSPVVEVPDETQQPKASSSTLSPPQRSRTARVAPVARPVLLRRRDSSLAPPKHIQPAYAKPLAGRMQPIRSADVEKPDQKRRISVVGPKPTVSQSRLHAGTASSDAKAKEDGAIREERTRRPLGEERTSTMGPVPPRLSSLRTTAVAHHKPRPSISTSVAGTGLKERSEAGPAARTGAGSSRTITPSATSSRTGTLSRAESAASLVATRAAIHPAVKPAHASHRSVPSISTIRVGAPAPTDEALPRSTSYPAIPAAASARSRPATVLGMASSRVSGSALSLASRLPATLRPASRAGIMSSRTRGTGLL